MILMIIGIALFIFLIKIDKEFRPLKKYIPIATIFIITTTINYQLISNVEYFKNIIENSIDPTYDQIIIVLISMVLSLIYNPIFVIILQKHHEKKYIKKYEKKLEVKEYEYYRDILNHVSPAIMAYCYNQKINIDDTIVATLLNLELRKIIKIENNKIIIIKDITNLENHEKLILEQLKTDQYAKKTFKKLLKRILMADMLEDKYIYKSDDKEINIAYFTELIMAWMILYILIILFFFTQTSKLVIILFLVYAGVFFCIPIYKNIQARINVNIRTKKALELGSKIKGMKNYIEDFSSIPDNEVERIKLYEEYVIYAIILNLKGKLNDDCKKIIQDMKKMSISNEI